MAVIVTRPRVKSRKMVERNLESIVVKMIGPAKKVGEGMYRHSMTGAIHKGGKVEGKLACGRLTGMMIKLEYDVHAIDSMCKICQGYRK